MENDGSGVAGALALERLRHGADESAVLERLMAVTSARELTAMFELCGSGWSDGHWRYVLRNFDISVLDFVLPFCPDDVLVSELASNRALLARFSSSGQLSRAFAAADRPLKLALIQEHVGSMSSVAAAAVNDWLSGVALDELTAEEIRAVAAALERSGARDRLWASALSLFHSRPRRFNGELGHMVLSAAPTALARVVLSAAGLDDGAPNYRRVLPVMAAAAAALVEGRAVALEPGCATEVIVGNVMAGVPMSNFRDIAPTLGVTQVTDLLCSVRGTELGPFIWSLLAAILESVGLDVRAEVIARDLATGSQDLWHAWWTSQWSTPPSAAAAAEALELFVRMPLAAGCVHAAVEPVQVPLFHWLTGQLGDIDDFVEASRDWQGSIADLVTCLKVARTG